MKKPILLSILGAITLALSGCSVIGFDSVKLNEIPTWDIAVPNAIDAWGYKDFEDVDKGEVNTNYIKLYNENKSCYIDGRIAFDTDKNAEKSDKDNSKNYLEGLTALHAEGSNVDITQTVIEDVNYVVAEYTLPDTFGQYIYHKTAVRVFSNTLTIPNQVEEQKGLPMVIVDMGCKDKKNITKESWDKASSFFKLLINENAEKQSK